MVMENVEFRALEQGDRFCVLGVRNLGNNNSIGVKVDSFEAVFEIDAAW